MEKGKKTQIEFLEMEATTKMKSALHGINSRLAITKEKISKLEDKNNRVSKMKNRKRKKLKKKINKGSVSYGTQVI